MTRRTNAAYWSFSTTVRRFVVNEALTSDRVPQVASHGRSFLGALVRGLTAWGLHPIGAGVVEPGGEVKLRLLDALDGQRLRASGLCSCGGDGPKHHAFSR